MAGRWFWVCSPKRSTYLSEDSRRHGPVSVNVAVDAAGLWLEQVPQRACLVTSGSARRSSAAPRPPVRRAGRALVDQLHDVTVAVHLGDRARSGRPASGVTGCCCVSRLRTPCVLRQPPRPRRRGRGGFPNCARRYRSANRANRRSQVLAVVRDGRCGGTSRPPGARSRSAGRQAEQDERVDPGRAPGRDPTFHPGGVPCSACPTGRVGSSRPCSTRVGVETWCAGDRTSPRTPRPAPRIRPAHAGSSTSRRRWCRTCWSMSLTTPPATPAGSGRRGREPSRS